ncbi:MAG: MFS transporter [Chitinophagales bacterium]
MTKKVWWIIIVASLGYFVDIYDLILFNIIKKESLLALGYTELTYKEFEVSLFGIQMFGMLIGGILWGILGDKRGRVIVLFGSILIYSLANIMNAFVTDIWTYKILRFIAGVGLAGELGAGVTLVTETMDKSKRGLGTMIIVTFGALGAVAATLVGKHSGILNGLFGTSLANWQIAYLVGGGMGLMLLLLRTTNLESDMFKSMEASNAKRGSLWMIWSNTKLRNLYLSCIAVGVPIWFIVSILSALADRFAMQNSGIEIEVPICIMWTYIGLSIGDLGSGVLSQLLKNRKKEISIYLLFSFIACCIFIFTKNQSADFYYIMCFVLGFGTGYWALFVLNSAEQFGTNLRSTASATVPNFVRGSVLPIGYAFKHMSDMSGVQNAAFFLAFITFFLAVLGTSMIDDSFDNDLDYLH